MIEIAYRESDDTSMFALHRDVRFDVLRVAAAFAVVWLHVSGDVVASNPNVHSVAWWIGNVADSFSRWCVPVFVMLSGALLLNGKEISPREFYSRRLKRLAAPLVFWSIVFLFLKFRGGCFDFAAMAQVLLHGMTDSHLWYLCMIVGLYLCVPILSYFTSAPLPLIKLAVVIALVASSLHDQLGRLCNIGDLGAWLWWPSYLGYFLAGYWLTRRVTRKLPSGKLLLSATICGISIALAVAILLPCLGAGAWYLMYTYLNPLVIIMSLCVFKLIYDIADVLPAVLLRCASRLAPTTLGIYLVHPLMFRCIEKLGINAFILHPLVGIPLTSFAAFLGTAFFVYLMQRLPMARCLV